MRRTSFVALLLFLGGCRGDRAPLANSDGDRLSSATGLERAAIESGIIADAAKLSPVGLFQRSHEAGRDSLCIIPGSSGELRFGTEAIFGKEQSCRGQGTAKRAGDKLILSFSHSDHCIIVARYDGDQISFPGVVDMKCADLCEGRGTLEGVSFPRVTSDASSALRTADRRGEPLCDSD